MLITGILIFILSSMLCAIAKDVWLLIIGRFIQGVGAAICIPPIYGLVYDKISGRKARFSNRATGNRNRCRISHWPDNRRLYHGTVHVAMDLLFKYTAGNTHSVNCSVHHPEGVATIEQINGFGLQPVCCIICSAS